MGRYFDDRDLCSGEGEVLMEESNEFIIRNLIKEYGTEVMRICMIYLNDFQLAEDIVQETFLKLLLRYEKTKNMEILQKPYILKTAMNLCKNQIRTRWFKMITLKDVPDQPSNDFPEDWQYDREIIIQKIMAMKPIYKDVILLYYYQEMSVKEIAGMLNLKESTVKVRLKRARELLKPELKEALDYE